MHKLRLVLLAALTTSTTLTIPAATPAWAREVPTTAGEPTGSVTLITGDRVAVRGDQVAGVTMAPDRRGIRYWQYRRDGRDFVVPLDAAPLLATGRLDERLFDVTGLVRQGYDDQHSAELPVIVSTPRGVRATSADLPASANVTRDLSGAGLLGLTVRKDNATRFWADVHGQNGLRVASAEKIWLDGKVRASLDQSVPMVGAPQAWQAGFRADGVKVAVLDTGVDPAHPDLAGRIAAAANFSQDADTGDGNGHGTHVASTVSGNGRQSGGRYVGVAPGAQLLIGKVLGNNGSGNDSAVIAGMTWAVEQGARVVSMSLGGYPSDGTDLLSQTLNQLSESSGALFVVAAGNSGTGQSVESPAAADRALAVASVTKSGELSVFSSRGPRRGDYGLKPEIAAPGSDIVAARAAGTLTQQAVDLNYAKLSGTSMATPHVAGAAAIVAGQHPDWKADQIKAALMGSAEPVSGTDVFGQGAGRVDVARAVAQRVRVEPAAVGLGVLSDDQPANGSVTYRNDGDQPVELALSLDVRHRDGTPAPAGLVTLGAQRVTVPAHGSATLAVTVTPEAGLPGQFVGTLRAEGAQVRLTIPVAVALAAEQHALDVRLVDRNGEPAVANVAVQNEDTGEVHTGLVSDGHFHAQVVAGRYRVIGQIAEGGWNFDGFTTFALPATQVDHDTELSADARMGKPVTVTVDEPTARPDGASGATGVASTVHTPNGTSATGVLLGGGPTVPLHAVGSPAMAGLSFVHISQWQQPWTAVTVTGPNGYELTDPVEQSPQGWQGSLTGQLVDVGDAGTDPGDLHGHIPLLSLAPPSQEETTKRIGVLRDHGAQLVLATSYVADLSVLPVVQVYSARDVSKLYASLARGPVEIRVDGRRESPYAYFAAATVDGRVPDGHAFRFARESMGRVAASFGALQDTADVGGWARALVDSAIVAGGFDVRTRWPQRRTDYYSPGFRWQLAADHGWDSQHSVTTGYELSAPLEPKAGEQRTMCLFCGPFGPELAAPRLSQQTGQPLPWAYRQGDKLTFAVPMFGDRDPNTFAVPDFTNVGTTVLYRDGREVNRNDMPGSGVFDVPHTGDRYRLVADATKNAPGWSTSVRTRAEWVFASQPSDGAEPVALPLLDVRFDLPLDGHNRAAAGTAVSGAVEVAHQTGSVGAPVRELGVEVSYDDGRSWQPAGVAGDGSRWRVEIPTGGKAGGFASLRATARDRSGNAVTETVIRAYQLS